MLISASILSANFLNIESEIKKVEPFVDWLHLDIMDGNFVPHITFGDSIVKELKTTTNLFFDVHLMVDNPIAQIELYYNAGADLISFHVESNSDILETIEKIKSFNIKSGIVINPETDVDKIYKYLNKVDMVLIMSVNPGYGGQSFIYESIDKVKLLNQFRKQNNLNYLIQIDGGINDKTAKDCILAGCDILVVGSYLYNSSDVNICVEKLY